MTGVMGYTYNGLLCTSTVFIHWKNDMPNYWCWTIRRKKNKFHKFVIYHWQCNCLCSNNTIELKSTGSHIQCLRRKELSTPTSNSVVTNLSNGIAIANRTETKKRCRLELVMYSYYLFTILRSYIQYVDINVTLRSQKDMLQFSLHTHTNTRTLRTRTQLQTNTH